MNIILRLVIGPWQIGSLTIRLDMDEPTGLVLPDSDQPRLMDRVSDYFASRYIQRRLVSR